METGNPDKEKIFQKLKIFTWEVIYVYDKSYMLILMCGTLWHQQTAAADRNAAFRFAAAVFYMSSVIPHKF